MCCVPRWLAGVSQQLIHLVQLVPELALQVLDIVVVGVKVSKLVEFLLECPHRHQILLLCVAGLDVSVLEVCVNEGSVGVFEPPVCGVELKL